MQFLFIFNKLNRNILIIKSNQVLRTAVDTERIIKFAAVSALFDMTRAVRLQMINLKNRFVTMSLAPIDFILLYLSLKIVHRYLWKIFKGPPRCWCRLWRYAKNTWTTPSRASPLLLLDSCVVSIKGHLPWTTRFTMMIARPSKVAIDNWEMAQVSKLYVENPIQCSIPVPYVFPDVLSSCRYQDIKHVFVIS